MKKQVERSLTQINFGFRSTWDNFLAYLATKGAPNVKPLRLLCARVFPRTFGEARDETFSFINETVPKARRRVKG